MKIATSLTTQTDFEQCVREGLEPLQNSLSRIDLLFVFASASWAAELPKLAARLNDELSPATMVGCTGESIVGGRREIEFAPALSLWAAELDGDAVAMHLNYQSTHDGGSFRGWTDAWLQHRDEIHTAFLLGDPYSFPADLLIQQLADSESRWLPLIGGMASGGDPSGNRIIVNDEVHDHGAALVGIRGQTQVRWLVSQGCRPVGPTFVVTAAERNVIKQLGGKPAALQLETVFQQAANREQELMQRGLQLGRVITEYQDHFDHGDFLVRSVNGVQPDGSLVIGDYIRPGQTVRFHIRDAETANAELCELLAAERDEGAAGALLFSCNGRGTRLFPEADHDARAIAAALDDPPLAGFFAQGEIGPVGEENFMHGYTAAIALWK